MVELEIDGQAISVIEGASIIEAADLLGIYIPRYCYHKSLSIAANCRMCLVEVEKVGKALPACATPVSQDMKVYTRSKKALDAQRAVLEFLLINHPLDCPICDQGGMCELQDFSMAYGRASSNYCDSKRSVFSEDIGPLISTWLTRCIQCTRCVRFGDEIAGLRELGVINRGEDSEIGTYVSKFVDSEMSANIIDICPVGALTAKPTRYGARSWELYEYPSVAVHDCAGSNVYAHMRKRQTTAERSIEAIVPRENETINDTWISDRDRFGFLGLKHSKRCLYPQMKLQGQLQQTTWKRVLPEIADKLQAIVQQQGADQLAFLSSPNASTEECYLLQKIARSLGCDNVDHRLLQQDFNLAELPQNALAMSLSELQQKDAIVLVGSHLRHEQPIIAHRVRQASLDEAVVSVINPVDFNFNFKVTHKVIDVDIVMQLAQLAHELGIVDHGLDALTYTDVAVKSIAAQLQAASSPVFLLGDYAMSHPQASQIHALATLIASKINAVVSCLTPGANSAGANYAGALPYRRVDASEAAGSSVQQLLGDKPVRAYVLFNFEPEYDCAFAESAIAALKQSGIVVCISQFVSPMMQEYADFVLPLAPFIQSDASYINVAGQMQTVAAASVPEADCKPGWKILRVLANFLELTGFEYTTAQAVLDELKSKAKPPEAAPQSVAAITPLSGLHRYAYRPIYAIDPVLRRSEPLMATTLHVDAHVSLNAASAAALGFAAGQNILLCQGGMELELPLSIDSRFADNVVGMPAALDTTAGFGSQHGPVSLREVG